MPRVIYGAYGQAGGGLKQLSEDIQVAAKNNKFEYNYPNGLDFTPGSQLHDFIINQVMSRANESFEIMQTRHDTWKRIDEKLTAFIDLDSNEKAIKAKDKRRPTSIVIPLSYAALQTVLTYWVNAFTQGDSLFQYEGTGPEDEYGAILLEYLIKYQSNKMKHILALHTMWRDALAYGIGACTPIWIKNIGKKSVPQAMMATNPFTGMSEVMGWQRNTVDTVIFEGNDLIAPDPYTLLLDPNTPVHRIQDGEFIGWTENTNKMKILSEEATDETVFNAEYVRIMSNPISRFVEESTSKRDRLKDDAITATTPNQAHRVHMYMTIIPSQFGTESQKLGSGRVPEKWLFTITGDRILQRAQPLGLDHNMYPIALCAPDFDGHSASPISCIETTYGCQEVMDFMMNSHVANVRKAINDMLIVDPYLVNINDLKTPGPGKLIRMRRSAWGRGVNDGVKQLQVSNITQSNLQDTQYLAGILQDVIGAQEVLRGVNRRTSERVTRAEVMQTQMAAVSRIERGARIGSVMAHQDLAYMLASHTQQFMSKDMMLKVTGRWEETLKMEYGIPGSMSARPIDIQVDWDVVPQDGSMKSGEYLDAWTNVFQSLTNAPQIAVNFDMTRIFMHMARLMGAKNLNQFVAKYPMGVQVVPDDILSQRVQQGRYATIGQMAA